MSNSNIKWNPEVKLIISDVDDTIATPYKKANPAIIKELEKLLQEDRKIFFVTGQGNRSIQWRILDYIPQKTWSNVLIGGCSGAEIWGFGDDGSLRDKPFYSVYEDIFRGQEEKKDLWRKVMNQLIEEFNLKTHETRPSKEFAKFTQDPLSIMYEDRGSQITFEVVNGIDLTPEQISSLEKTTSLIQGNSDLRIPLLERAEQLFAQYELPISSRTAGVFALDFAVKGVSKTTAVKKVVEDPEILQTIGLTPHMLTGLQSLEIWGDKFAIHNGGTDRHMCEALPKEVRAIDFREEDSSDFLPGYNIVLWNGEKHLDEGLLEYLQSRA